MNTNQSNTRGQSFALAMGKLPQVRAALISQRSSCTDAEEDEQQQQLAEDMLTQTVSLEVLRVAYDRSTPLSYRVRVEAIHEGERHRLEVDDDRCPACQQHIIRRSCTCGSYQFMIYELPGKIKLCERHPLPVNQQVFSPVHAALAQIGWTLASELRWQPVNFELAIRQTASTIS